LEQQTALQNEKPPGGHSRRFRRFNQVVLLLLGEHEATKELAGYLEIIIDDVIT
jgi:hypothetical protein